LLLGSLNRRELRRYERRIRLLMIVRPRPSLLQLFFITRGSIVPRIAPQIVCFTLYAAAIVAAERHFDWHFGSYGLAPFTLLGVTLSIYLVFRNNAAYDRWWEGRKLWGQLVFDIRNFSRATLALLPAGGHARPLLMQAAAFCHLLRAHLRNIDASAEARRFAGADIEPALASSNKADGVIRIMGLRISALKDAGSIDPMGFRILDERLGSLAAVQAGCERIAGTPLPFAYTLLLHRSAYLFCLMLPFGLADSAGWYTCLFTAFIAYSFFGLDALSEELEEPFGMAPNDLPLDALCRVCEISLYEALGEVPPKPLAADHYLYT
jgi:ion channel-forming bestrophin family protein